MTYSSLLRIILMCFVLTCEFMLLTSTVEILTVSLLNMWIKHLMSIATLDTSGTPVIEHGAFLLPVLYFLRLKHNYMVFLFHFLTLNPLIYHSLLFQIHGIFIQSLFLHAAMYTYMF